jgi:hypothetical protein
MGPTAGSSGLALIIGISEGTLGGLVGVQPFFAAADHVAVWGARVPLGSCARARAAWARIMIQPPYDA